VEQASRREPVCVVDSDGRVIQSFLREDLIDELIVARFPLLLGKGIPLFGELERTLEFEHVETEIIEDYLVKSRYRRIR